MVVFRIERKKYLNSTLEGIGPSQTEGFRWNSLNTYMVYTSDSRSLAMLEVSAHFDLGEDLPLDRFYIEIEIPNEVEILELGLNDLPVNWNSKPPGLETQFIGDDFVISRNAAVLKVPSCIVSKEFNYLINPNHVDANKIKVLSNEPVSFDSRVY